MLVGLYRYRLGNVGWAVSYQYRLGNVGWAVIIYIMLGNVRLDGLLDGLYI